MNRAIDTFHTKPLQKTRKETGTLPANHAKGREKRKDFPFKFSVPFACLAGKILDCELGPH